MEQERATIKNRYRKKMTIFWWARQASYLWFIIRELTSLPVAYFSIVLVFMIRALSIGPEAYAGFLQTMQSPVFIILNSIALVGLVYHSLTWFSLAAKAMVVRVGKHRVPGTVITWLNFTGWIVISAVIIWLIF